MANTIGMNYSTLFKSVTAADKRTSSSGKSTSAEKDVLAQYGGNYSVELSDNGLNALAQSKNSVEDSAEKNVRYDETKLSSKAQDLLDKLRDKYGDYDFIIADNVDDPQSLTGQSTKGYSVILSSEEIEKMAEDDDYADKIMGYVGKAVDAIDGLFEQSLEDGVQFGSITASIDDEGNMKLFASLEKMTEEQQERFEKLKEKRAEEKEKAESTAEEETDSEEEVETVSAKVAKVEADSAEELLKKIFEIDWDNIEEEEFVF